MKINTFVTRIELSCSNKCVDCGWWITRYIIIVFALLVHTITSDAIAGRATQCAYKDNEFQFETCRNASDGYYCSVNTKIQNWFQHLYNKSVIHAEDPPRIRREIRTLSAHERHVFFRAVNDLKNDKSIEPNMYDAIAAAHSDITFCSAHKGSNFLGWHRIYLLMFEAALRDKESSVVLPYWASSIDSNPITDPKESIIFSDQFLGNGDGYVTTGSFGGWTDRFGCPIERNIASNGTEILSAEVIEIIENDNHLIDIANITDADHVDVNRTTTLEYQHNLLHNWVGGMLQVLDTASSDPVFFLHHAYIDYIWEQFREKQKQAGIEPAAIYPGHGNENYTLERFHAGDRIMNCFSWMSNKEGYSNIFTESVYRYADQPRCPNCGSEFLTCDTQLNRCIPALTENTVFITSNANCIYTCSSLINVVLFLIINVSLSTWIQST